MKSTKLILYEVTMSILALVAVVISIIDIVEGINSIFSLIDFAILIIFVADYLLRLILAKNKLDFIKSNILDLIAIIPFNSFFKMFRVAKLARLAKLSKLSKILKLSRLFVYIMRFSRRMKIFFNTNGFKYSLVITIIFIFLGAISIRQFENMKFADSLWWAFVTTTTVGYGDISPTTSFGRITAVILMITGIGLIGSLTSTITSYFFSKSPKRSPRNDIIHSLQKQIENIDNLSDDDIDEISSILKSLRNSK